MAFVPVTDPHQLRELGLANLLWFRWSDDTYRHAIADRWAEYDMATLMGAASRGRYHILLED